MRYFTYITVLAGLILASCKQDSTGDLKIINESDEMIFVKFSNNGKDTVIGQIESQADFVIKIFDVKGNAAKFNCCPCQASIYSIYTKTGKIKRDPMHAENWEIPNRKKLNAYGTEQVRCEFRVKKEDL